MRRKSSMCVSCSTSLVLMSGGHLCHKGVGQVRCLVMVAVGSGTLPF